MADNFLNNYALQNNITLPKITNEAYELLNNYYWPGNVRELRNVIETAVALNTKDTLTINAFTNLISNPIVELKNYTDHRGKGSY